MPFLEFHAIQNFAPSNLNRDDTGAPKDALFGGHRRARVSSQCFKRAMRLAHEATVDERQRALRTKRLVAELAAQLGRRDVPEPEAVALAAVGCAGFGVDERNLTQYLVFLGRDELGRLVEFASQHADALRTLAAAGSAGKKGKGKAKGEQDDVGARLEKLARDVFDGSKALDLALFGRMLADMPRHNVEAACQVAHAISTHRVEREFDYFTAVDDIRGDWEQGADMIGTVEFNSACLYRYAALDLGQLVANLGGDSELAIAGAASFARAFADAIPTGKQATFAAHNRPEFIGVALRSGAPRSLSNAFADPVVPRLGTTLSRQSVERLAAHEQRLAQAYGDGDRWIALDLTDGWEARLGRGVASLDELVDAVRRSAAEAVGG